MNQSRSTGDSPQTNHRRLGRIAFVQALWHRDLVDRSYAGFVERAQELEIGAERIDRYEVPGSLELPLQAMRLAELGDYAVIVAAGLIVDGGIYRHDFVARTVLDGLMRVQLDTRIPVLSVVLTPHQFQESSEHIGFFNYHLFVKGQEAANACTQTLENLDRQVGPS